MLGIQDAWSVVYHADQPNRESASATGHWVHGIAQERNKNITAVALASKNGRIFWTLLEYNKDYEVRLQAACA